MPKLSVTNNIHRMAAITLLLAVSGSQASELDIYGDVLLRYENSWDHNFKQDIERMRFIGHLGASYTANDNWFFTTRFSTGLKDKQNTPAITIHRFNDQPLADKNVFLEWIYARYTRGDFKFTAGKIPWQLKNTTDLFWDRDLDPWGFTVAYQLSDNNQFLGGVILPLDGQSSHVGRLVYASYTRKWQQDDLKFTLTPWYAGYEGEQHAYHATRDTQYDNHTLRLSGAVKQNAWQLGFDAAHSISDFSTVPGFEDEKTALVLELKHGSLKKAGQAQAYLRYLHVERFSVLREFAQNGTTRLDTGNYKGWEVRYRYKLQDNWWVGARFSDTETLVGPKETGKRFRLETKYSF